MYHGQKSRFFGDGHPTFDRNGYINPYYWVDDHPLLYGNNGSLDPGTHHFLKCSKIKITRKLFFFSLHRFLEKTRYQLKKNHWLCGKLIRSLV